MPLCCWAEWDPLMRRERPAASSSPACTRLYAGLIFVVTVGLILAPVVHRLLHKFHWEQKQQRES